MANIHYVNNAGGGFSGRTAVENGTTIGALFAQKNPSASPDNYKIRVNGNIVPADYVLAENDRVVISPTKVQGA